MVGCLQCSVGTYSIDQIFTNIQRRVHRYMHSYTDICISCRKKEIISKLPGIVPCKADTGSKILSGKTYKQKRHILDQINLNLSIISMDMCTRVLGSSIRPRSTYEYITLYTRPATWMAENVNPHKYLLWKGKGKGSCRALISISFATFVVIIMVFKPFMTTKHVYILLDLCVSSKFFSFF